MVRGTWNELVQTDRIYPHSKGLGIKPRDMSKVTHIILHTTGSGYLKKVNNDYQKGEIYLAKYYSEKYTSHYMIGKSGFLYQFIKDQYIAPHTGLSDEARKLYRDSDPQEWKKHIWDTLGGTGHHKHKYPLEEYWRYQKRWGDQAPPLDYPNTQSVGIDLQGGGKFTEQQYKQTAKLIVNLCQKYNISMDYRHIIGHEDAHPMARTAYHRGQKKGVGGWDPGVDFDWAQLFVEIHTLNQKHLYA